VAGNHDHCHQPIALASFLIDGGKQMYFEDFVKKRAIVRDISTKVCWCWHQQERVEL
jgi:hypothetical protein